MNKVAPSKEQNTLASWTKTFTTKYRPDLNLKYRHTDPVFKSRHKAVRIDQDSYLQHITRYISKPTVLAEAQVFLRALLPKRFWAYLAETMKVLEQFDTRQDYMQCVADYEEIRDTLNEIKYPLGDQ